MNDRTSHRAAVEAGYADLAGYVAKYGDERPSLHGDGHVGPVIVNTDDAKVLAHARTIVSQNTPHYSYVDIGDVLVSYLRGERNVRDTMQALDYLALDYECLRRRT